MFGAAKKRHPDLGDLLKKLRSELEGEAYSFSSPYEKYARDESILCVEPLVVVCPRGPEDVQTTLAMAREFHVPITPRGGGSGVAGQALGQGIILDFSVHMHRLLGQDEQQAWVQPGMLLDDLNQQLSAHGRRFAPDPSSRAQCAIGGMIGTNASGPKCFHFGPTRRHVLDLQVALADGSLIWTSELSQRYSDLVRSIRNHQALIEKSMPKVRKNSSGYDLLSLCQNPPSFTGLLVGSEGTLGITVQARLGLVPVPSRRWTAVYAFSAVEEAVKALSLIREMKPVAIELVDHHILQALRRQNPTQLDALGLGEAEASLWVEWEDEEPKTGEFSPGLLLSSDEEQAALWSLRSKASKALHEAALHEGRQPLRCIEDVVVPPAKLLEYIVRLRDILRRHDCDGAIFGHAGDAHLHVNPMIEICKDNLAGRLEALMDEVYILALELGGSISGEHGDGILRRKYVERQWKSQLLLFQAVKNTLDPMDILNPGKIWSSQEKEPLPLRRFE